MNYLIDAPLERGRPQLRVVDARTGAVRLQWTDSAAREVCDGEEACTCGARASLRQLFKALIVLACADPTRFGGARAVARLRRGMHRPRRATIAGAQPRPGQRLPPAGRSAAGRTRAVPKP